MPILMSARNPEVWKVVRFAAVFAIVLLGGFWVSGWRHAFGTAFRGKETAFNRDDEVPPMLTISTAEELDVALKSRLSVFFVDADWSFDAAMSRSVVYPLVRCWRPLPGASPISFFRLDLTDWDEAIVERLRFMLMRDISRLTRSGELLLRRDGETTIVDFPQVLDRMRLRERLDRLSED